MASGHGLTSATSGYGYTAAGDLSWVDGPLAGGDDTSHYLYDAARRPIGAIGPDPDGSGPAKRAAQRIVYDAAGRATSRASGSAAAVGALTGGNFTVADEMVSTWSGDRKASDKGTGRGVVQYDYDVVGRPKCTVQRMNLAPLSSQPVDPCQLNPAGPDGPDRLSITRSWLRSERQCRLAAAARRHDAGRWGYSWSGTARGGDHAFRIGVGNGDGTLI